jgi:hypothetical protein
MEEDIIIPTDKQKEAFSRLGLLFSNPERVVFYRINEKAKVAGLEKGDVVIVERGVESDGEDIRMYLDPDDKRYLITRKEITSKKYWGKVSWILKTPKNFNT